MLLHKNKPHKNKKIGLKKKPMAKTSQIPKHNTEMESDRDDDQDSDSGHESGGRFVKRPASPEVKAKSNKSNKRKAPDNSEEHQRKVKALKQLYKPPTLEEINRLKETENFYHSNLFRLQVEEMLSEVKVKVKVTNFIDRWLDDFRKFLRTVKDAPEERSLANVEYCGVDFPLEIPQEARFLEKGKFQYLQQRIVHQIGSTKLGISYGQPIEVDLVLEIPDKCLQSDDYLNMRYHFKRAHFLCHLAEGLIGQTKYKLASEVHFIKHKGDPLKPVLEIVPFEEKFKNKIKFVVHAASWNKYPPNRFLPEKNNVRPALIGSENVVETDLCPTPHYNASIMYDLRLLKNQDIAESMLQSDHVRQAIILLKIWTRQRRFDTGFYGFDGALITFYIVYLLHVKAIYNTMSSYQIIRLFWNQLANSQWDTLGITMETSKPATLAHYQNFYEVVFIDSSGLMNICANLSAELYRRVKQEAAVAIQLLDNRKLNSFIPLFLNKYPTFTQYDHILSIEKPDLIRNSLESFGSDEDKLNFFGNPYGHFRKMIGQLLRKGLGARASFIVPIQLQDSSNLKLTFGIMLDPREAYVVLDKGPEAIQTQASAEYREFWRGKAELRRFKDGSITESCVWGASSDPIGEKRLICQKIVLYLLNAHYDIPATRITYLATQFEASIKPEDSELHQTTEERSLACIHSFDSLCRILKDLDDIPLMITSLDGTDAVFRYADPNPPRATAKALLVNGEQLVFLAPKVVNATIQLEASGKWPEKLDAIRRLKSAFYLKIAEALRAHAGQSAELVPQAYADYLEVLYAKYVFRFYIIHQREITLVREYLAENKITKLYRDTDESVKLEMQATIMPKLTNTLHGLHQQYFSFGSVAAMAKRWLYSQLIDPFLWPDECTELIVASLYMKNGTLQQPQAGFLRFLEYMAHTDWSKELILLNFNDEIPDDKVEELEKQFTDRRDTFPPLAIVTSCDSGKFGLFSRHAPCQEVLNRVTVLAQLVVAKIENDINCIRNKVHIFYKASYTGYDAIIHLDETMIPATGIADVANFTQNGIGNLLESEEKDPAAGFNPAELYLDELREAYRKYAIFFYDSCGGDRIGVLWRPDALSEKPFTSSNVSGRMLSGEETLILNQEALIHDFEIIGKGLVQRIDRKL